MSLEHQIRDRLRSRREQLHLSQTRLAGIAAVNPATINLIERGERSPNTKTLEKISNALRVTPWYFLRGNAYYDFDEILLAVVREGGASSRGEMYKEAHRRAVKQLESYTDAELSILNEQFRTQFKSIEDHDPDKLRIAEAWTPVKEVIEGRKAGG